MTAAVYLLCLVTSALCAVLLTRSFLRTRTRLLMWSALCFLGLAANNAMLVLDRLVIVSSDLSAWRLLPAIAGFAALLFGLVWEDE